jgi:hypothetical protein
MRGRVIQVVEKPSAMPRPIPPLPPVTTATRPLKSNNPEVFIVQL